jgi:hypothetical protein
MRSGIVVQLSKILLLLSLIGINSLASALTPEALLNSLAQTAPQTTAFIEVRYSRLLEQPIVLMGELQYQSAQQLARIVKQPFQERTEINLDHVIIERPQRAPKKFSLRRAPELMQLTAGLLGILSGDQVLLSQHFNIATTETKAGWVLQLVPKSSAMRQPLQEISFVGSANQPRCMIVTETDQDRSFTLLEPAATLILPTPLSPAWLEQYCLDAKS